MFPPFFTLYRKNKLVSKHYLLINFYLSKKICAKKPFSLRYMATWKQTFVLFIFQLIPVLCYFQLSLWVNKGRTKKLKFNPDIPGRRKTWKTLYMNWHLFPEKGELFCKKGHCKKIRHHPVTYKIQVMQVGK